MGGINCGGGGGGNVSLEFSTEYIEQLASYCKSLFDGSAKFFEANVAIEDAVMTGGDLVTAMQLLSSSVKLVRILYLKPFVTRCRIRFAGKSCLNMPKLCLTG